MTKEQTSKFLSAIEAAGITSYEFTTDLITHMYNNDHAIIKFNEADEMIYNVRAGVGGSHKPYAGNIEVVAAWCEDAHEARTAGNYDQIKTFLEELGNTFTDSDIKILLDIDKKNYQLIPDTGDYNRFIPLTPEQYDELTPEEKEAYDAAKEAEEKRKHEYIGQNVSASITLG